MTDERGAPPDIRTYSLKEVAEMMGEGVSLRALQDKCRSGELRAVKVGSSWRVSHANVVAFLNGEAGSVVRTVPAAGPDAQAPQVAMPSMSPFATPAHPQSATPVEPAGATPPGHSPAVEEERWSNGQIKLRCPLVDGARHGEFEAYHADGTRASRGFYVNGRLEGDWEQWHADGRRWIRGTFRAGLQDGSWTYWGQDGTKTQEVEYAKGLPNGRSVQYHDNGAVWCEGQHEGGAPSGEWRYFDRDGRPV